MLSGELVPNETAKRDWTRHFSAIKSIHVMAIEPSAVGTMGGPAFFYHWFYRAHSLKSLKRNILSFAGIKPIKTTLIGWLGGGAGEPTGAFPPLLSTAPRERWLDKLHVLGRQGY
jgi:hypothetical protein